MNSIFGLDLVLDLSQARASVFLRSHFARFPRKIKIVNKL